MKFDQESRVIPIGATIDVPTAPWPTAVPAIYRRTVPEQMAGSSSSMTWWGRCRRVNRSDGWYYISVVIPEYVAGNVMA
jgi:hypothetical protein